MKRYLIIIIGAALCLASYAQNIKRPESYNYQRGQEAMRDKKYDEAIMFFNKDIEENPENGYSFIWIATLRDSRGEYGLALTAAEAALKKLPKKDVDYVAYAHSTRASIYLHLEDSLKALSDYNEAVRLKPKEIQPYEERAQLYYELGKYDLADEDYRKMTELKPGSVMGYMGLGRNANEQKHYVDAIKQFDYVTKLASDYASGYSFRAESYIGLEKWNEATDDIVSALALEWDRKAMYLATTLKDPAFTMLVSKMKIQSMKSPNEARWPFVMATMYQGNKQFQKAIESYEEANKRDASPVILGWISQCYSEIGQYDKALNSIEQALNMDSTDLDNLERKADVLYDLGKVDETINVYNKILEIVPDYANGYCQRAWYKKLLGDLDGSVEDMSMCIVLEPANTFAYQVRGDVYMMMGKKELAELDFKKVIEIEDTPDKYSYSHYAYQCLGQYDKSIEIMDLLISKADNYADAYYDAASVYARMGNKPKALDYLKMSFENGYRSIVHLKLDPDMNSIRDTDEFKALIKKYEHPEK